MQVIETYKKITGTSELAQVESLFQELIPTETQTAKLVIDHVFGVGGKRVRPQLFLLICDMIGYHGPYRQTMAAIPELIHAASLLHDDVIDNSPLRRGRPSSHVMWGDVTAILVGDLIYSRASELMAKTGKLEIVSLFAKVIREMSEAEILQLEHLFDVDMNQDSYFRILKGKTASLISAACEAPAILADAPVSSRNALKEFGMNVGLAFQLIDDALDFVGSTEQLGKKASADLREGKLTHPVLSLKAFLNGEETQIFTAAISGKGEGEKNYAAIFNLVQKYETPEQTLHLARHLTDAALTQLNVFPESAAKSTLISLTQTLLSRVS